MVETISLEVIPFKVRERFGEENILEVTIVDSIEGNGGIEAGDILQECKICGKGNMVYSLGPGFHMVMGELLWIKSIWAWRCNNEDCYAPLVFKTEVRDEMWKKAVGAEHFDIDYSDTSSE